MFCCRVVVIVLCAVNSEIFARILFPRIALKDIFAMLKFTTMALFTYINKGIELFCHFEGV